MIFLDRVLAALRARHVTFALAGGYAVALHGAVRGTVDVDIVLRIERKNLQGAEAALKSLGLVSRLPVDAGMIFDFRDEYIKRRNLKAWSFCNSNNPTEVVDILITHDLKRMRVKRVRTPGGFIPLVSIEDLIAMKTEAGRPQDLEDIRALRRLTT